LVDKANGRDYPASVLFAWKALAEARVLKQMNDRPSPLGWVESIEFTAFAGSSRRPKVVLSRHSLLYGKNGAGKSSLMHAAASVSHAKYAEKFFGTRVTAEDGTTRKVPFRAKVVYSTADSLSKELRIDIENDELTRHDGSVLCLLPPGDFEVVYCSRADSRQRNDENDVDFLMRLLNIDRGTLFALAKIGTSSLIPGELEFRQAEHYDDDTESGELAYKENDEPYRELFIKQSSNAQFSPVSSLSGSERDRLIIDLLITKAREVSKQRLTLLLIDDLSMSFDLDNFEALLTALSNEEFQSIVTFPPGKKKDVLQIENQTEVLKPLDYLKPWRLTTIVDELPP